MSNGSTPGRRFQKRVEAFVCLHCRCVVEGDGYTNHCPHCLWSKHVDLNPGDRANPCRGAMEPIAAGRKGQELFIIHRCRNCGQQLRNRTAPADEFEIVLQLLGQPDSIV